MEPLQINLRSYEYADRRLALLLMAAAIGLLLLITLLNFRTWILSGRMAAGYRDSIRRIEARRMEAAEPVRAPQTADSDAISLVQQQVALINRLIAQDIFPWGRVLSAFEENMPENIYLEAFAPDALFNRITLTGYAASMSEVSGYLKEKEENPLFREIDLLKVDVEPESLPLNGEKMPPVHFAIESVLQFEHLLPASSYGSLGGSMRKTLLVPRKEE